MNDMLLCYSLRQLFLTLAALAVLASPLSAQPRFDLTGLAFILDPGHSRNENVGMFNYSEANKVLRVGFHLREFLQESNADTVVMTRTDSLTAVSISQRYTLANNFPHPNKWFHSIHSDAAAMGSSVNSILILISDNCWVSSGRICQSRWGQTTISMGDWQSDLMARTYRIPTRGTYGDRTFGFQSGTSYGSSGVPVLRETQMPATLSEGGFHTNPRQNLLNMNNESKRSEAKAIWMAMLGHFGAPRPPIRTLVGVISDIESGIPLKGAAASIGGQTYTTNTHENTFAPFCGSDTTCSNGFYYFENLPAGLQSLSFSAPGYYDTTVQVSVIDTFFTFRDIQMLSSTPPRIVSSLPSQNQNGFPIDGVLRLEFSRRIARASAEANIHLIGPTGDTLRGVFSWSNLDRTLLFDPDSILMNDTTYSYIIGSQVRDLHNHPFDGNADGVGGDALVITFRTRPLDTTPPVILTKYPSDEDTLGAPNHVITVTFDEVLDSNSVTLSNFVVGEIGGSPLLARTLQYWVAGSRSGVNIYVTQGLQPGKSYRARVSGVGDRWGNVMTSQLLWSFAVDASSFSYTAIDDFNSGVSNWWQPTASGSTVGVDSARFGINPSVVVPLLPSNAGSAELTYYWRPSGTSWLLREYLNSGPPRSVLWRKDNIRLQVYLFGDGGGSQFRFAIDDSVDMFPGGTAANHEVSLWRTIDWVGWRLIEWDLERDPIGSWLGNGRLEGQLRFDSFQLQYLPGTSAPSGKIYFDQLQLAQRVVTSIQRDPDVMPSDFALHQNYPNPFNPETRITYDVGRSEMVRINIVDVLGRQVRTLAASPHEPGRYTVIWDSRDDAGRLVASGLYFYRLQAETVVLTGKMTLLK